jgi:adenosylhomocysteine nucleosidase
VLLVLTGLAQESRIAAGPGVSHVVCSGSNPDRLRSHLADFNTNGLRAVVSFGLAGGLHPLLAPGDIVVGTSVIAENGAWRMRPGISAALAERMRISGIGAVQGAIVGVEEPVLEPAQKNAMHRETDAIAVDMESHIGAAFAASKGLPFAAIRVISDPAARSLPALAARALKADGRVNVPAVICGVARAPSQLLSLIRAGGDAGKAFAELRRCSRFLDFGLCFGFADL